MFLGGWEMGTERILTNSTVAYCLSADAPCGKKRQRDLLMHLSPATSSHHYDAMLQLTATRTVLPETLKVPGNHNQ